MTRAGEKLYAKHCEPTLGRRALIGAAYTLTALAMLIAIVSVFL